MATVSPRLWAGKWVVDLRPEFGSRYVLPVLPDASELDAVHAAYALLAKLRRGAAAESPHSPVQPALAGTRAGVDGIDGECLFRFAVSEFQARKQYTTKGGQEYGNQYLLAVRKELGDRRIREFEAPGGDDVLLSYRNGLRESFAAKTTKNRLNAVMQVLRFCHDRRWLLTVPREPLATNPDERLYTPRFEWITEQDFRSMRAEMFRDARLRAAPQLCTPELAEDYVARRRLYLSFGFYGGFHTLDVDNLVAESVGVDIGVYLRTNHKSSGVIAPAWFDMPEPLKRDCEEEIARLGRPWRSGEKICGGPWKNVTIALQTAARRLGLPPCNLRVFRRSMAREYALRGWTERDVSELLGHVDQRMIREVYLRVPVRSRSPRKIPWTCAPVVRTDAPKSAPRVIQFPQRKSVDSDGE